VPVKLRQKLSPEEQELGLLLTDPMLFTKYFWKDDLTIPEYRTDLPAHWLGEQVLTLEQRLFILDGAMYFLFRDTLPDAAKDSNRSVLARTARKVGKTIIFESHYIQAAITNTIPGVTEGLFHAPGEAHLSPVLKRIDSKVDKTPLFKLLHKSRNQSQGIDEFRVGEATFVFHRRIEGQSGTGRNMVGLRAFNEFGDEGDYGQMEPYNERQQTDLPNCFRWWGGVPRGVRGQFWTIARTALGEDWSRHVQGIYPHLNYDMRASPLYHSQDAWGEVLGNDTYDSQRVQTQVLGLDGEEARSTFPIIAVDLDLPFVGMTIRAADLPTRAAMKAVVSRFPFDKVKKATSWVIHSDYGFAPDPMVLGISYQTDPGVWNQFARITLLRMDNVNAARFIHVLDTTLPQKATLICLDAHGRGRGTYENLHGLEEYAGYDYDLRVIPVGFETSIPDPRILLHKKCRQPVRMVSEEYAWACSSCGVVVYRDEDLRPATVPAKQVLTSDLAEAFSAGQKWLDTGLLTSPEAVILANDPDLIDELQGTTSVSTESGRTRFQTPRKNVDHNTDTWRCLMRALREIRDMQEDKDIASFEEYGWV